MASGFMGGMGVAALAVNIAAALALMRFREGGDANARAIRLFSRNDTLANVAVIIDASSGYTREEAPLTTHDLGGSNRPSSRADDFAELVKIAGPERVLTTSRASARAKVMIPVIPAQGYTLATL